MPQICSVAACRITPERAKNLMQKVAYYCFPKDEKIRDIWIKQCKRKDKINVQSGRVCSLHFRKKDFERDFRNELLNLPQRLKLKKGSIPRLNLTKCSLERIVSDNANNSNGLLKVRCINELR